MPLFPKQTQALQNQKLSFVSATPKASPPAQKNQNCGEKSDSPWSKLERYLPFYISWRNAKPCFKFLKGKQNYLKPQVSGGLCFFGFFREFFVVVCWFYLQGVLGIVLSVFLVANFYFSSPSLGMVGPYDPHISK